MNHPRTVILYHGGCPDGFGSAYAAWKKFGESADYIPVKHNGVVPEGLVGKEIYLVDFCYPQEITDQLQKDSASLVVLDHHEGMRQVIESVPHHVYDATHSGATLAWNYFNPGVPLPTFLQYVEDADLFKMIPDEERAILRYCYTQGFRFEVWGDLIRRLEIPEERAKMIERGKIYAEHFSLLAQEFADAAELVEFEGHICYLGASEKMFITDVGSRLTLKRPPIALVARVGATGIRVSLRSDGSVDVSKLAQKYGGNGHPNSAAFSLAWGAPIPWQLHNPKS
jgi:uncharacterized protein